MDIATKFLYDALNVVINSNISGYLIQVGSYQSIRNVPGLSSRNIYMFK